MRGISGNGGDDPESLQRGLLREAEASGRYYAPIFENTPMVSPNYTGNFGTIYVRQSLVSQYQNDPN